MKNYVISSGASARTRGGRAPERSMGALGEVSLLRTGPVHKGNQKLVKSINRNIVLNIVRQHGPISRADAARMSQLYPATVSSIVNDLIDEGFVREVGLGDSTGGRQPVMLELNRGVYAACGASIEVGRLRVCLTDLDARVLARAERPLLWQEGPRKSLPAIVSAVREIIESGRVPCEKVLGVGVVYPGPVDTATGTIQASPHMPGWGGFSLKAALEDELGHEVVMDNDANAAAWGEKWFGAARGRSSFLYVMADYGLGGGIIIDDRLYRGRNDGAGEIGHMTVDIDGPQCKCGNFGCLDVMASGTAIARKMISDIKRGAETLCRDLVGGDVESITMDIVLEAAAMGDSHARAIVEESGRYVGIGLANLVNCFNPELIVLGGQLALRSNLFFTSARETARRRAWPVLGKDLDVVLSALGHDACVIGATSLVLTRVFESPSIRAYA
ncbi:MAG: ROK family transcriptional regulator [Bacillota bacterium]|nr:ROK family transcriptional regulator [Bacillota bacterium]